eukprot:CAMPEP_0172057586 /NCGR_PEP_ID=MMETSP1043-20130122/6404_1 /TAXON_ID=464988 /ORGANISM="Hemiselmis andersenii, Strain CCMP441" /LENGTH=173 /DNA_ID=CAMNT_0012717083 /DNA_START=280 /DNA_END=797 /DNA_ORIENTATION=+
MAVNVPALLSACVLLTLPLGAFALVPSLGPLAASLTSPNRIPSSITLLPTFSTAPTRLKLARLRGGGAPSMALQKLETPPVTDNPVFSLATLAPDGTTNMNILTYASPVGVRPVRRWALGLYTKTATYENFAKRGRGVLQLLGAEHAPLVTGLGGSSSLEQGVNKEAVCGDLG